MSLLPQLTVNGLVAGSVYALVACGFSLIYSANGFINFAHGVSVALGAYILYWLFTLLGAGFYVSCLLTVILSGFIGVAIYRIVYLRLEGRGASSVVLLVASLAVMILSENLIIMFFGSGVKTIGFIKVSEGLGFLGAVVSPLQATIFASSILLIAFLHLFLNKTKVGRDIRAAAANRELASIVGIDSRKTTTYSFFIGSLLAGVAGVFVGLEQNLEPTMGTGLMIKGFTGAVVGGVTSVPASILGGYLLGFAENYGIWFLPSGFKDGITFLILFVFLLLKPTGLFGLKRGGGG